MPGCVISPSSAMCAPVSRAPALSARIIVKTLAPIRGTAGSLWHENAMLPVTPEDLAQPPKGRCTSKKNSAAVNPESPFRPMKMSYPIDAACSCPQPSQPKYRDARSGARKPAPLCRGRNRGPGLMSIPFAGADRQALLTFGGKHVVVHPDDHGDKNDGVVKKVQLYARKEQLQHAHRNGLAPKIVMHGGLRDQQQVLDVMPELDDQRDGPPCAAGAGKTFAQDPNPDQHH